LSFPSNPRPIEAPVTTCPRHVKQFPFAWCCKIWKFSHSLTRSLQLWRTSLTGRGHASQSGPRQAPFFYFPSPQLAVTTSCFNAGTTYPPEFLTERGSALCRRVSLLRRTQFILSSASYLTVPSCFFPSPIFHDGPMAIG